MVLDVFDSNVLLRLSSGWIKKVSTRRWRRAESTADSRQQSSTDQLFHQALRQAGTAQTQLDQFSPPALPAAQHSERCGNPARLALLLGGFLK